MNYLERYLEDVRYHLYGKDKNDIIKELKSDILNKLGDDYSDDDLIRVLEELGSPSKVADTYNFNGAGLSITGENFNIYVKLVKLMFTIGLIVATTSIIGTIFEQWQSVTFIELILKIIGKFIAIVINFTMVSIGIITTSFYFIQKYENDDNATNIKQIFNNKSKTNGTWTIKDLKVKRYTLLDFLAGTSSIIFITVLFLVYLFTNSIPSEFIFFYSEYTDTIATILILSVIFEITQNAFRYFKGEKKVGYVILNLIRNIYLIFTSWYILIYKQMFFVPQIIQNDTNDSIFIYFFILNVVIGICSIAITLYRYIKYK